MKSAQTVFLQPIISLFIYLYLNFLKSVKVTGRKVRGLQTRNRLQVSDFFFFFFNLFLKHQEETNSPWKYFSQAINETMYLLWNLPFFKMALPKTNIFAFLKSWADNSSTNQESYQLFYGWGITHLVPSYLKYAYCGRGAW